MKVVVNKLILGYAGGSVTPIDLAAGGAGGYVFAAKVGDDWKVVADGNGMITCAQLKDYPDFPTGMISGCVGSDGELVDRTTLVN